VTRRNRLHRTRVAALAAVALALSAGAAAPAAGAAERIDTVAGSGDGGFGGDGGLAVAALLTSPSALAPFPGGEGYLIADTSNNRIRRVDAAGLIATVAGAGPCCGTTEPFAGNLVPPTDPSVRLNQPRGVALAGDGSILIADTGNHRIRRVGPAPTGAGTGTVITTVAGNGIQGFGSNDAATTVSLNAPRDVAPLPDGGFLIADTGNDRIARVLPGGTRLFTVAGGGGNGLGDGGPATGAQLSAPSRVVPLAGGGYLIADTGNDRIRRVGADGTISTVAGSGAAASFSGDGGPATQAALSAPEGIAVRDDGSIAIADTGNERIRLVAADGTISTVAGTGALGFAGDGGDPLLARLSNPRAVAGDGARLRIADSFNHRVRAITAFTPPTPPPTTTQTPPRAVPPGVAPPVRRRSTVAAPVSGTILIRLKGRRRFVALTSVSNIPLGSELDARRGRVSLQFATTAAGRRASAIVGGGRFVVDQRAAVERGQLPGNLLLSGPLSRCAATRPRATSPHAARPRAQAAGKRKRGRKGRRGRRIDVNADGAIRTQGRYGAAIVRGTRWTIVDRCPRDPRPGTFVAVRRGTVAVTAFALRRTVLVDAGRRFLAPPRRARRR